MVDGLLKDLKVRERFYNPILPNWAVCLTCKTQSDTNFGEEIDVSIQVGNSTYKIKGLNSAAIKLGVTTSVFGQIKHDMR